MCRLNRYAAEKMHSFHVSACTDITGFGLLCHLLEMCGGSGNKEKGVGSGEWGVGNKEKVTITAEIWPDEMPIFEEAAAYAGEFLLTAAGQRNRNHFGENGLVDKLPFAIQELMFDPQTSGGLLICVDTEQSEQLLTAIQKDDPAARIIGRIIPRQDKKITWVFT
jgi:selenide,water dikinase